MADMAALIDDLVDVRECHGRRAGVGDRSRGLADQAQGHRAEYR